MTKCWRGRLPTRAEPIRRLIRLGLTTKNLEWVVGVTAGAKHIVSQRDPALMAQLANQPNQFCAELDVAEATMRRLGAWPKNAPSVVPAEDTP
jgi:hypothetical protein